MTHDGIKAALIRGDTLGAFQRACNDIDVAFLFVYADDSSTASQYLMNRWFNRTVEDSYGQKRP